VRPSFAQVTYAHLRSRLGESDAAAAELEAWTAVHRNFAHELDLALFHLREGRSQTALKAVRAALDEASPPATEGNRVFFGYQGAVLAFMLQDYELCHAMCDKMNAVKGSENWWLRRVLRLQAAAAFMTRWMSWMHGMTHTNAMRQDGTDEETFLRPIRKRGRPTR
jgi:hypothetical protein